MEEGSRWVLIKFSHEGAGRTEWPCHIFLPERIPYAEQDAQEEAKDGQQNDAQAGARGRAQRAPEADSANEARVRAVLDFSRALQTAKNVMQLKQDWEQRKAYLEQQQREAASNDIDQWEIPPEDQ